MIHIRKMLHRGGSYGRAYSSPLHGRWAHYSVGRSCV